MKVVPNLYVQSTTEMKIPLSIIAGNATCSVTYLFLEIRQCLLDGFCFIVLIFHFLLHLLHTLDHIWTRAVFVSPTVCVGWLCQLYKKKSPKWREQGCRTEDSEETLYDRGYVHALLALDGIFPLRRRPDTETASGDLSAIVKSFTKRALEVYRRDTDWHVCIGKYGIYFK